MQFTIVAVGNLRGKHWQQACSEYLKRLGPYAETKVLEIAEALTFVSPFRHSLSRTS